MRLPGTSMFLLSLSVVTACGSDPPVSPSPVTVNAAGSPGDEVSVGSDGTRDPSSSEGGTQTGGEGDQLNCGEAPYRWEPVDETVPLLGTYRGALVNPRRGSVLAEFTISNPGAVVAMLVDSPPYASACLDGRRADVDWSLRVDGVLSYASRDSIGYEVVRRSGQLGAQPALDELALEVPTPVPQDFRDLGMPTQYYDDARLAPDRVTVDLYVGLGYPRATVQVQWRCDNCGSNRVGLALLDGDLERVAE